MWFRNYTVHLTFAMADLITVDWLLKVPSITLNKINHKIIIS